MFISLDVEMEGSAIVDRVFVQAVSYPTKPYYLQLGRHDVPLWY